VDSTETPGFFLIYFIFKNNSTGKKHAMLLEKNAGACRKEFGPHVSRQIQHFWPS
jgi:hypothetical protein